MPRPTFPRASATAHGGHRGDGRQRSFPDSAGRRRADQRQALQAQATAALPLPKQQAARAINWAEYSQLESRVRSLECADSTHSAAATLTLGAKKEHRTAPVPGTPRVRAPQPRPRRTSRPARRAGALHPSSQRRVPRSLPLSPPAPLSRFWGTTLWQPQTWASGGVEGSIERSKKILKECDTNLPFLRARARAAQERMATAVGEERRAAHAVSSKASFSAQMVTMKKQAIDSNPSQRLRELLAQEASCAEQLRQRSAMSEEAKALVKATGAGVSYLQKALGSCLEAKVLHEQAARVVIPTKPSAWAGDWAQAATPAMPRPDPSDISRIDVDGRTVHAANPLHGWAHASGMVNGGVLTMDFGGVPISGRLSDSGAAIEWSNRTKWRKVAAVADRSAEAPEPESHSVWPFALGRAPLNAPAVPPASSAAAARDLPRAPNARATRTPTHALYAAPTCAALTAPPRRFDPRRASTRSRCSRGATRACAPPRTTSTKGASTCSAAARPRSTASTRSSPPPWTNRWRRRRASRRRTPRRSWHRQRHRAWEASSASSATPSSPAVTSRRSRRTPLRFATRRVRLNAC